MNIFHLSKFQKGHWDISGRRKIAPRTKICNSMPFGAAWAYYGKVLVLASAAS